MEEGVEKLDETNKTILKLLQENPQMSYSEIARQVGLSQPAVSARILKLERRGIMGFSSGINFKTANLPLMNLELICSDPSHIKKRAEHCPFILNVFNKIGKYNYQMLLTASNMDLLNQIPETCFRKDENFQLLSSSFIMNVERDFILPVNFDFAKISDLKNCPCPFNPYTPKFQENYVNLELGTQELKEWQSLIEYVDSQVSADLTFLSRVRDDKMKFIKVNEDNNYITEGTELSLAGNYCEQTIKNKKEYNMVVDATTNNEWKDSMEVEEGWVSYLGFPVRWPNGTIFGTFCVASREKKEYESSHIELLKTCRNLIEVQLKLIYQSNLLNRVS